MSNKKIYPFPGDAIDVTWDERLCIHIGECGQAEGDLFVMGRDPWCNPDLAALDDVAEVVERCPTGAISYQVKGGTGESAASENSVMVSYNGPYFIKGALKIEGIPEDMPGVAFRAALCRCGHSNNKPFCDNSHELAGFTDYGAVGNSGTADAERGGELTIKCLKDGPLLLKGNVSLTAGSGRRAWQGNNTALCRCGASKKKPFCDGSHKEIGFKSD